MDAGHIPVLLHECIDNLNIRPDGIYVDGTLGMGGHSEQIAGRLTTGTLIGIDRDETAIARAGARLAPFGERVQLVHGNFRDTAAILDRLGIDAVDGMLFDLGVSSPQLDETQRGFSYMHDAPLDMRMDATSGLSAWNVVNEWPENELKRILYEYGEERYAPRIAGAIVRARAQRPISTTLELVDVIRPASGHAQLSGDPHRRERRAGGGARDDGHRAGQAPRRRAAVRHQLSFPRGPDRQDRHRPAGARLHLPARGTGVHLRLCADAAQRLPQADPARRGRTGV